MDNSRQTLCLALQLSGHLTRPTNRALRKAAVNVSRIERLRARPVMPGTRFKSVFSEPAASDDARGSVRRYRYIGH